MRAFVAIDFSDSIKNRLADAQNKIRQEASDLKCVKQDNMHLTLKFLGEIRDAQAEPTSRALDEVAGQCRPFDVRVERAGVFGNRGQVKVVWIGIQDAELKLAACWKLCEELLEPLGFAREQRPFSPHLTIARNRHPKNDEKIRRSVSRMADFSAGTQHVSSLTFYESTLTPHGPTYQPLSRHPFAE